MLHPKQGTLSSHPVRWITSLCLFGLVASTHAGTHTLEGRIVGVTDGDTITLLDVDNCQHKIRLDGIDAPESGQPFGRASKQHLAELLANREAVAECSKIDRYRREVCRPSLWPRHTRGQRHQNRGTNRGTSRHCSDGD